MASSMVFWQDFPAANFSTCTTSQGVYLFLWRKGCVMKSSCFDVFLGFWWKFCRAKRSTGDVHTQQAYEWGHVAIIVAQVHSVAGGAEADDNNVTCNVAESRANVMVQASRSTSHARIECVAHTLSTLAGTSAATLWHSIALQRRR